MQKKGNWTVQLRALADESRLRIMSELLKRPLHVNALADELGTSQYNVSKHLRILREAGLVDCEIKANRREYLIAERFRSQLRQKPNELDLGCCTFRFDYLAEK